LLRDDLEPDERRVVQVVVVTGNFDDGAAQIEIFRILHVLVLRVELNFPIEPGFFTRPLQIWSVFHRQVHESVVVVRDQAQIGAHLEAQVWNGRDGYIIFFPKSAKVRKERDVKASDGFMTNTRKTRRIRKTSREKERVLRKHLHTWKLHVQILSQLDKKIRLVRVEL